MPVDTQGTDIDVLAVGVPLHLYPTLIKNVLSAIKEHSEQHPEHSIEQEIKEILNGF